MKEGYFEELVFKKEMEPKAFSECESDHLGQIFHASGANRCWAL